MLQWQPQQQQQSSHAGIKQTVEAPQWQQLQQQQPRPPLQLLLPQ
jgi:hypothetical protein